MHGESSISKEAGSRAGFEAIGVGQAITVDDLSGTDDLELNLALAAALVRTVAAFSIPSQKTG